jgi:hypothetical protein
MADREIRATIDNVLIPMFRAASTPTRQWEQASMCSSRGNGPFWTGCRSDPSSTTVGVLGESGLGTVASNLRNDGPDRCRPR